MYNRTDTDQQYLMRICDRVEEIIEESTNYMNATHPLSEAHLSISSGVMTLLNHADNTTKVIEVRDNIDTTRINLNTFIRHNCIDITTTADASLFNGASDILRIMEYMQNNLDVEICYRTGNYTYSEAASVKYPVFTYRNSVEILDSIFTNL